MSGLTLDNCEARAPTKRRLNLTRSASWVIMTAVAGISLGMLTVAFVYLLVFGYFIFTPEQSENSASARELATGWAPMLFFTLCVWIGAFSIGTWTGRWHVQLGLLIGMSAAIAEQATILVGYPPIVLNEFVLFMMFGAFAGVVGGWLSKLEATRNAADEKILFREMVHIARAQNANAVAEAIANLVGRERVAGVGVWRHMPPGRHELPKPDGIWNADGSGSLALAMPLEEMRRRTRRRDYSMNLVLETLDSGLRSRWANAGVRSAFASPLICIGDEQLGLLFICFRRTILLAGVSRRRVLSAAAAAGMALEKLAGLEKQRQQDRELGVMEERERVSREIHDSLIQYLGSIAGELDAAEMAVEAGATEMTPRHIHRAREAAQLASRESRRFVMARRPVVLDRSSFPDALRTLTQRSLDVSGINAKFKVVGEVRALSPDTEHNLVRIAQEVLSNAIKHSRASLVSVTLSFDEDHVSLEVVDNGIGLDVSNANRTSILDCDNYPTRGFGFQSLRERTERISGQISVESSKGRGTTVIVKAPA